jgi:hypothetical protein
VLDASVCIYPKHETHAYQLNLMAAMLECLTDTVGFCNSQSDLIVEHCSNRLYRRK